MKSIMLRLFLVLIAPFTVSFANAADIPLALVRSNSNIWENQQYQNFIQAVQNALPEKFKQVLQNKKIELEFVDFSENSLEISQIDETCARPHTKDESTGEKSTSERKLTIGEARTFPFTNPKIHLNSLLWIEILKGPQQSYIYNCGHRTGYRLAMATLIHELGHLYDSEQNASKDRRFLHLMTFSLDLVGISQKNNHAYRSADLYELTNPKEAFAVNLEYFIMDSEFKCRRPTMYQYYREKFDFEPYKTKFCSIDRKVMVTGFENAVSLDENRLYRIDYLLADKGTAFESKFGHSMLRLVFCAPGKPKSKDCLTDVFHHVVVSFRGNPTENRKGEFNEKEKTIWDEIKYILKGIGVYSRFPSEMFLLSMPLVITEYNHFDFRDLVSTPLNLTDLEKRDMLHRIIEIKWGYSGSYKFFTNNCRTETEDLIKAIVRSENIENISAVTPVGLREELYDNGFALNNAKNKELTHRSIHYYTKQSLAEIQTFFEDYGYPQDPAGIAKFLKKSDPESRVTLETYANAYSPDQRRLFILSLKNHFDENKFKYLFSKKFERLLNDIISIELAALSYQRVKNFLYTNSFFSHLFEKDVNAFSSYLKPEQFESFSTEIEKLKRIFLLRQQNQAELVSGYGIPQSKDWTMKNALLIPEQAKLNVSTNPLAKDNPSSTFETQVQSLLEEVISDQVVNLETDLQNLHLLKNLMAP